MVCVLVLLSAMCEANSMYVSKKIKGTVRYGYPFNKIYKTKD